MIKQEDYKYKTWLFTWNETNDGYLIDPSDLENVLKNLTTDFVFQKEFVSRLHYQGFLRLENRVRKQTLLNLFKVYCATYQDDVIDNLTLLHTKGTDKEVISYVTKTESRIEEPRYSPGLLPYRFKDLAILSSRDRWYPWQDTLGKILLTEYGTLKEPDDRTILWIRDAAGNSGKSKLVKYYVHKFPQEIIKLPFGTATQLRSAICTAGPRKLYFIDIPRTMGRDEDLDSVYSVIEDIKNGFITTSMYGSFKQLLFDPPHVVIFANFDCPRHKLSADRWNNFILQNKQLLFIK